MMDTLTAAGADPGRVIMGHLDVFAAYRGWPREMAGPGCCMEWDTYGLEDTTVGGGNLDAARISTDSERITRLELMLSEGFGDRVVIGHDVCTRHQRRRYGGKGYAHILESVAPRLRARGIGEGAIEAVPVRRPGPRPGVPGGRPGGPDGRGVPPRGRDGPRRAARGGRTLKVGGALSHRIRVGYDAPVAMVRPLW